MIRTHIAIAAVLSLTLIAACKKSEAPTATESTVANAAAAEPSATASPATKPEKFDINQYPISSAPLGDFPYVSLPAGYSNKGYGQTEKTFARFPFWVNGEAHWVSGRFYGQTFSTEPGKDFSALEVSRNFDALIRQMGGVKVSEGRIPGAVIESWGDEITQGFIDGLGDVYNNPATTYLVRRAQGDIWVHLVNTSAAGAFVLGQEEAFQQTAQLQPAAELKKQIDSTGKVALKVNFATDKTDILPDSLPQIEQVLELLKADPSLKLSINGHTDNSGDKTHNQRLSEGRAKAVVEALVAGGIDAVRLTATGFGDTQPVAENTDEEGRAANRRVELVKR